MLFRRDGARAAAARIMPALVPLPPARPFEFGPVPPASAPLVEQPAPPPPPVQQAVPAPVQQAAPAPPPPATDTTCAAVLASGDLTGEAVAPVMGAGGCGIAAPLRLTGILLPGGARVAVVPPALMRCTMAKAVADWVRADLAPAVADTGAPLVKLLDADAYDCRGRNRVAGARLSEHAQGNAFDVRGLVNAAGKTFLVEKQGDAPALMQRWKASACARFTTVLGPGSDGYHENHAHVDLAQRRNGYRLCQWQLR